MTNMEKLQVKLSEMKARGSRPAHISLDNLDGATPEDVAGELLEIFSAIEKGMARPLIFNDSQKLPVRGDRMPNTKPCGCCDKQLNEDERKSMMEVQGKMYSNNINDNIQIIQAEAIRYAAEKLRTSFTNGGEEWLCEFKTLIDYAAKVERGEECVDDQY